MHESIPTDSNLATRLKSGYYTARLPREVFAEVKPCEPATLSQAAWEAYYDAHRAYSEARRAWKLAGEPSFVSASVKHRKDRQEEFRTDLLIALGIQDHRDGLALVLAAELTAKGTSEQVADAREESFDYEWPMDNVGLSQAADIAARFAAFLKG